MREDTCAFTFYFEEIFPDYETFETFIKGNSSLTLYEPTLFDDEFLKYSYVLLARHYNHTNIRYSDPESFKAEFLNVFDNKYQMFKKQKALIDDIYSLTAEDLELIQTQLNNVANNPNEYIENPKKLLNFISLQNYNELKNSKFVAYLQSLNQLPTLNIYNFFKPNKIGDMGFDDLFMKVVPNIKYYYEKE